MREDPRPIRWRRVLWLVPLLALAIVGLYLGAHRLSTALEPRHTEADLPELPAAELNGWIVVHDSGMSMPPPASSVVDDLLDEAHDDEALRGSRTEVEAYRDSMTSVRVLLRRAFERPRFVDAEPLDVAARVDTDTSLVLFRGAPRRADVNPEGNEEYEEDHPRVSLRIRRIRRRSSPRFSRVLRAIARNE